MVPCKALGYMTGVECVWCNWSFCPGVCPLSTNNCSYTLPEEFFGNSIKANRQKPDIHPRNLSMYYTVPVIQSCHMLGRLEIGLLKT
jgi:hypothetical protein